MKPTFDRFQKNQETKNPHGLRQEEPKNMGPWSYVAPRLGTALRELTPEGLPQAMSVFFLEAVDT